MGGTRAQSCACITLHRGEEGVLEALYGCYIGINSMNGEIVRVVRFEEADVMFGACAATTVQYGPTAQAVTKIPYLKVIPRILLIKETTQVIHCMHLFNPTHKTP